MVLVLPDITCHLSRECDHNHKPLSFTFAAQLVNQSGDIFCRKHLQHVAGTVEVRVPLDCYCSEACVISSGGTYVCTAMHKMQRYEKPVTG